MNKKTKKEMHIKAESSKGAEVLTGVSVFAGIVSTLIGVYMIWMLWTGTEISKIIIVGVIVLIVQLLKAITNAASLLYAHNSAYNSLLSIRVAMINRLKKLPISFFQKRKSGELAGIVDHDVERVEMYLAHTMPEVNTTTLVCVLSFITIAILNWKLALVLIIIVPIMLIIMLIASPFWKGSIGAYQDSMRNVSAHIMEYINTIPIVKAFGAGEKKTKAVLDNMDDYIKKAKKAIYVQTFPLGVVSVLIEGSVAIIAVVGCIFLNNAGVIGTTDIVSYVLVIILAGMFTQNLMKAISLTYNKTVYAHTMGIINEVMDGDEPAEEGKVNIADAGDIVFENVGFSYEEDKVALEDLNVTFLSNTTSAIVGPSGAGKSTIASLLMKMWKYDKGSVTIAGEELSKISEDSIANLISVVQQETFLLNISIAENIKIGRPDASLEEVTMAAKKAQIHETIMSFPEGYDSIVGEGGAKISGGEKQRISLARMILKDSPIVILDEATSAIDPYNEALIQNALAELCKDKTLIVIAHHLNTIRNADQILVIDSGKLVDAGKHERLLENCELYKAMWDAENEAKAWSIRKAGEAS